MLISQKPKECPKIYLSVEGKICTARKQSFPPGVSVIHFSRPIGTYSWPERLLAEGVAPLGGGQVIDGQRLYVVNVSMVMAPYADGDVTLVVPAKKAAGDQGSADEKPKRRGRPPKEKAEENGQA